MWENLLTKIMEKFNNRRMTEWLPEDRVTGKKLV